MINISKCDKAEVLTILFNHSKVLRFGFYSERKEPMTIEEANMLLNATKCFDYLYGKPLKIELKSDILDTREYDRILGHHHALDVLSQAGLKIEVIH